ncbi:MAG: patatin-like phospholipase family protein [Devosia nanyangense]|uniref:Patatin-like phospholipase family protein n=1 Tax=Devosia nanyangense TaxID=1228055 RepID=A0A933KYP8_9HYPH|nr:patatin-like phospholipase family protein [Devosia nanyangense]
MAHDLTHEDEPIPILQRGQELIDRLNLVGDIPEASPPTYSSMPRIGVALGGGSARGLTHIPFIEAMDELGLKPATIAGTSIGALIGAGWANGMSGKELREHAISVLGTMRIIAARLWGAQIRNIGGLLQNGFNMQLDAMRVVDAFLPAPFPDDFAELQIPFYVVATDFQSWHQAVFNNGQLKPAIAGSIAIPSLFKPVRFANHVLVDGGVVNPLPLDQAGECDILVGIDVNGDPSEALQRADFKAIDVWFGSAQIMMHSLTAHMMAAYPPDVYARPHLSSFGALEFWRVKEILAAADKEKDHFKRHLSNKVEQFIMQTGETTRAGD